MKNFIVIAILALGSFQLWQKYSSSIGIAPLFEEPYVAVYGRNSCGFTKKMISKLERNGLNFRYFIVDEQQTASSLHARMESSGISTKRYNLPVVDVNGNLEVRPDFQSVLAAYNET